MESNDRLLCTFGVEAVEMEILSKLLSLVGSEMRATGSNS